MITGPHDGAGTTGQKTALVRLMSCDGGSAPVGRKGPLSNHLK
jgi:hypothetical protein